MLNSKSFLAADFGAGSLKLAEFEQNEAGGLRLKQYGIKALGLEGSQESTREAAILKVLQGLDPPPNKGTQQALQEAVQYISNNVHRMDYPYYLAQGWQIGSGPIESACKTVVGQRLKLAGMRWREYGTDNVCHLRALFKSEQHQWNAFWERHVN